MKKDPSSILKLGWNELISIKVVAATVIYRFCRNRTQKNVDDICMLYSNPYVDEI
jgi:hypothetical protein